MLFNDGRGNQDLCRIYIIGTCLHKAQNDRKKEFSAVKMNVRS